MDGLVDGSGAGCSGEGGAGFCAPVAGADCAKAAMLKDINTSRGRSISTPARKKPRAGGPGACATSVRNDLKNDRIVNLRIFFRHGSGYIDFETVDERWSDARLILHELRSELQGDTVEPKSERRIRSGESGEDGGSGCVLRGILYAQAEFGGHDKMLSSLLHLDIGIARATGMRNRAQI